MSAKRCMNASCGGAVAGEANWRKGWLLKSGDNATLCDKCGLAYEQLAFCENFHQNESGWRECAFCGKRLHCGCIASKPLLDLLDGGGVQCLSCSKTYGSTFFPNDSVQDLLLQSSQNVYGPSAWSYAEEERYNFDISPANESSDVLTAISGSYDENARCNILHCGTEVNGYRILPLAKIENGNRSFGHVKSEQVALHMEEFGFPGCTDQEQSLPGLLQVSKRIDSNNALKDNFNLAKACLSMTLGVQNMGNLMEDNSKASTWKITSSQHCAVSDMREKNKSFSAFQHDLRDRHHRLPRLPKGSFCAASDAPRELIAQVRIARPPAEGRGRNQLLPRYWPRITDQELQQITGDSNSTIVPLFEKVLSASDAGRIGRLVLPKACAEAYFPPISQPEGLPLKIQDAKGKEWHFQFRFWPNNNSRMYVLEGVTPCIQSLQLQAGDTVTFSRIDPEGKLVMGYRKATNNVQSLQDSQISAMANGFPGCETVSPGVNENLSTTDKHGGLLNEGLLQPLLIQEKRRSRNIGSRTKRLLMDTEDAMELKFTWLEAQDFLLPPPKVKPSIVIIEDQEFEEYEDPPVLAKRTFNTVQVSGGHDQWIQCDDCFRWRRIPLGVLPPSKWACADNTWDPKRSSCAAPDELTSTELHSLLRQHSEMKRKQITTISSQSLSDLELTNLKALAGAAGLGETGSEATTAAVTTRHPRHRPGCTCIVCIQPPSGKGPKHSPSCSCNVCMTVKRRFKTLMMRKKKRQSEREDSEANKKLAWSSRDEIEDMTSSLKTIQQNDPRIVGEFMKNLVINKAHIDLNCQPRRDAEQQAVGPSSPRASMMNLLQAASRPLESYLKQNKLASLTVSEQQVSSSSVTVHQAPIESESGGDEEHCGSDKIAGDAAAAALLYE
ncbi:B3 domain-containing protein [Apostasia shenzhenica]|uniref:B3 domain-containing protein n=1 Tax=Apostasia shenzhenica TaxID=1088818 RepID=A0A2I0BHD9_9ASPA|nr:B3 domain-containing protein [Apostasia shenzhenica]